MSTADRRKFAILPKPSITLTDLGQRGWDRLHELARRRGRTPQDEVVHLVRYALKRSLEGEGVELTDGELDEFSN